MKGAALGLDEQTTRKERKPRETADVHSQIHSLTGPQPTQQTDEPWFKLRVNTHVQGTKNRHVLMMWLPKSWGAPLEAMARALEWIEHDT